MGLTLSINGGLKRRELFVSVPSRLLLGVSGLMMEVSAEDPNIMFESVAGVLHRAARALRAP